MAGRGTDTGMGPHMSLIVLSLCVCARSESLGEALKRRSDIVGVYASDYAQDYEPVIFAAVALHAPVPVLQVLSSSPLTPSTLYGQPYYGPSMFQSNMYDPLVAHSSKVKPLYNTYEPLDTVLYARPNKYGGYTYHRHPAKRRHPPKRKQKPVIIRVHKYRTVSK